MLTEFHRIGLAERILVLYHGMIYLMAFDWILIGFSNWYTEIAMKMDDQLVNSVDGQNPASVDNYW